MTVRRSDTEEFIESDLEISKRTKSLKFYIVFSWILIYCGIIFIVQDILWVHLIGVIYWLVAMVLQYTIGLKALFRSFT